MQSIDSPWLRLSVDVGHAFLTSQIGGPPPDQWIREAGAWLAHVHLQDSDGCADRHWRLGQGNLNWFAIFNALNEIARRHGCYWKCARHAMCSLRRAG
ncbi:MAG: TIM barrel protein [Caldilineaceae bacterium]